MNSFRSELRHSIELNVANSYGKDNYDEERFGPYTTRPWLWKKLQHFYSCFGYHRSKVSASDILTNYEDRLQLLWENLTSLDRSLLVEILAYRLLGYKKVKLSTNTEKYWVYLQQCNELKDSNHTYNPKFLHFLLYKMNLNKIGYDIELYFTPKGVATIFMLEQYVYRLNGKQIVYAEPNDVVLDLGGCWGDTALYFAHCVGACGKVYSFEFIPGNIQLHNINTALNPELKQRITLCQNPVMDQSDLEIYFKDNGPASIIRSQPFPEHTGRAITISIDDFVSRNSIKNVDYIKMDIEGSEQAALNGAERTIRKFRPKLAISIYHSLDDIASIPKWVLNLNLGYRLYLGHYTIHKEETVLFAKTKSD